MTNPYDPNEDKDPKDSEQGFNPYPPSSHPEDRPQFGQDSSASYPQNPSGNGYPANNGLPQYGDYNNGTQGYQNSYDGGYGEYGNHGAVHPTTRWTMLSGNPQPVELGRGISFAFKEIFGNPLIWILGGLVYVIVTVALDLIETAITGFETSILSAVVAGLVSILIYRLALNAVSGEKLSLGNLTQGYSYGRALAVFILIGLAAAVALIVVLLASGLGGAAILTGAPASGVEGGIVFLVVILVLVALLIIAPITMMITIFPIDKNTTVGESFRQGFDVAKRNLGNLILYILVTGLVTIAITVFTLGIGAIIAVPFTHLTAAYAFRTVTGGPRPVPGGHH